MKSITSHVLDTTKGKPAKGIRITLEFFEKGGNWRRCGFGTTDEDGRVSDLFSRGEVLEIGVYRLIFNTASYFSEQGVSTFYPKVHIIFEVADPLQHYHVPLLLNPFGYSTYRGS